MATALNQKEMTDSITRRPYTRELIRNEDGSWFARIVEFTGCMTEGDTQEEALTNLEDAMVGWIEARLEDGDPIPEPMNVENYSGKIHVRVAKSLHRDLIRRADTEGVSLNQYITTKLASAIAC